MSVDDALIDDESSKAMRDHARRILEGVLGIPATEGNLIEVLRNGDEIFPRILEETPAARTIDFLTFVYWKGSVGENSPFD